jgi:hypothetical protein
MASSDRFVDVGEEEMERLLLDKDSKNTKRKIFNHLESVTKLRVFNHLVASQSNNSSS